MRNSAAQSRYTAQASAAQVATALLSTQSQLAQDYFQLRALDEQRRILEATLADYEASIHLVDALIASGVDSNEDLAQAENQLATAEAQTTNLGIARAQYEHAIAVLIGLPPAKFTLAPAPYDPTLPTIPIGLPSELLERRADIAAAERQVAAANAGIGVARAAYFPALTLSASAGYQATSVASLFDWPNRFWSAGSTLAQVVFDGGVRSAAVAQARALDDAAVANYRQTVLGAFQSVEDNLASLRVLSAEMRQLHRATVAAQRAVELSVARYKSGVDSYVNVITAQNTFLSSREAELQAQLNQQIASVNLINNLGRRLEHLRTCRHRAHGGAAAAAWDPDARGRGTRRRAAGGAGDRGAGDRGAGADAGRIAAPEPAGDGAGTARRGRTLTTGRRSVARIAGARAPRISIPVRAACCTRGW